MKVRVRVSLGWGRHSFGVHGTRWVRVRVRVGVGVRVRVRVRARARVGVRARARARVGVRVRRRHHRPISHRPGLASPPYRTPSPPHQQTGKNPKQSWRRSELLELLLPRIRVRVRVRVRASSSSVPLPWIEL